MRLQRTLGVSYIFITHDMAMVRSIADEITVMKDGRVIESGAREQIFSPPRADYTDLLIKSTPQMQVGWLDGVLADRDTRDEV